MIRLRKRLGEIAAVDFFAASGRASAESAVEALERRLRRPEKPTTSAGDEGRLARQDYRGRTWVTRKNVHVDRVASAWLIRRFIEDRATFRFVPGQGYRAVEGELTFDMYEGTFTHVGDACTFETLLDRFGLAEPGLSAIGEIVHDIDVKDGKFGRAEAPGFAVLIAGIAVAHPDDERRIEMAARLDAGRLTRALRAQEGARRKAMKKQSAALVSAMALTACGACSRSGSARPATSSSPELPLVLVADVPLPGGSTRFDYQEIDAAHGHLVVTHMNDNSVLVLNLGDASVAKLLPNIPTPRGVTSGDGRIFVTSSRSTLVVIDGSVLTEIARVATGNASDGVGYDPVDHVAGVSDQQDGAVSLIAGSGTGARVQVPLGSETGNVIFDPSRDVFWAAVVNPSPPDQLVQIDPVAQKATKRIDLPGCSGAHGVRLHPDGQSAFVACENNNVLARVDLVGARVLASTPTGAGPDVLSVDPGLGWLYVAAESGDLVVFDIRRPGLVTIDQEHPGDNAHSVAVDPATHRVFFPLMAGPHGGPVMRVMQPKLVAPAPRGS